MKITSADADRFGSPGDIVLIMDELGFVKIPIDLFNKFISTTKYSANPDGTVRHYHCLISNDDELNLFFSNEIPKYSLKEYFYPFE